MMTYRGQLATSHGMCLALLVSLLPPPAASAYTPESPEVRELVESGLHYLAKAPDEQRMGGACLVALAFMKDNKGETHPKIASTVKRCHEAAHSDDNFPENYIYSLGLAIIFLCELDSNKYRREIDLLLDQLQETQKSHGGWGYLRAANAPEGITGDTSMTQYGVLATWTAHNRGVPISMKSSGAVCNWLIRTQDPGGGWGYQGNDPGNYERIAQSVSLGLAAAGAGSMYVLADLFGESADDRQAKDPTLPPALELVVKKTAKKKKPLRGQIAAARVSRHHLRRTLTGADRWHKKNYRIDAGNHSWQYYYLYALERYQSFRERVLKQSDPEPEWYNDGVDFLHRRQQRGGRWIGSSGEQVSTAFAVLFLLRSTQKAIRKYEKYAGTLQGGQGLPKNTEKVRLRGGQVIRETAIETTNQMLNVLESPNHPDYEDLMANPVPIVLSKDKKKRGEQIERLHRIVETGHYQGRILAIRALAHTRELDQVPTLIFGLSDGDHRVVRESRDGLRFISRRFNGFGLPNNFKKQQVASVAEQWKQWYLSVRPDADGLP